MNIPVVRSPLGDLLATREQPATRPADSQPAPRGLSVHGGAAPASVAPAAAPASSRTGSGLPVQAPAGTDPALWSILTAEERTFFARQATSGPLTYFKVMMPDSTSSGMSASRGRRIDVRA